MKSGWFRVDPWEEKVDLNISHHKGAAYGLATPDEEVIAQHQASKHGIISETYVVVVRKLEKCLP